MAGASRCRQADDLSHITQGAKAPEDLFFEKELTQRFGSKELKVAGGVEAGTCRTSG